MKSKTWLFIIALVLAGLTIFFSIRWSRRKKYELGFCLKENDELAFPPVKQFGKALHFSEEQQDLIRGKRLIHTHFKTGGAFSPPDVWRLFEWQPKELRAIGLHHRYSLIVQPEVTWPDISSAFNSAWKTVAKNHQRALNQGQLTRKTHVLYFLHDVWTLVAEKCPAFDYYAEERSWIETCLEILCLWIPRLEARWRREPTRRLKSFLARAT